MPSASPVPTELNSDAEELAPQAGPSTIPDDDAMLISPVRRSVVLDDDAMAISPTKPRFGIADISGAMGGPPMRLGLFPTSGHPAGRANILDRTSSEIGEIFAAMPYTTTDQQPQLEPAVAGPSTARATSAAPQADEDLANDAEVQPLARKPSRLTSESPEDVAREAAEIQARLEQENKDLAQSVLFTALMKGQKEKAERAAVRAAARAAGAFGSDTSSSRAGSVFSVTTLASDIHTDVPTEIAENENQGEPLAASSCRYWRELTRYFPSPF